MKKTKNTLRTALLGIACILFSKPIGMCFMIVGEVIINGGELIKNLF